LILTNIRPHTTALLGHFGISKPFSVEAVRQHSPLGSGSIIELSDGRDAGFWAKSKQSVMPSATASRAIQCLQTENSLAEFHETDI
jgi:hypothetical protein